MLLFWKNTKYFVQLLKNLMILDLKTLYFVGVLSIVYVCIKMLKKKTNADSAPCCLKKNIYFTWSLICVAPQLCISQNTTHTLPKYLTVWGLRASFKHQTQSLNRSSKNLTLVSESSQSPWFLSSLLPSYGFSKPNTTHANKQTYQWLQRRCVHLFTVWTCDPDSTRSSDQTPESIHASQGGGLSMQPLEM